MLSGRGVFGHGYFSNWTPFRKYITIPTVFSLAHEQSIATAMIVESLRLQRLLRADKSDIDLYRRVKDPHDEVMRILRWMRDDRRELIFLHFGTVDNMGHKYGWGSPEQLAASEEVFSEIELLLRHLRTDNTGQFLVIITADHGGGGHNHGSFSCADMTIPWVIYGDGIKKGYKIRAPVYVYDTAATALYALHIPQPKINGKILLEAFEDNSTAY